MEEDKDAKLICQEIIPFDAVPRELWIRFSDLELYQKSEEELLTLLEGFDGNDSVVIYCENDKAIKRLPRSRNVNANQDLISRLNEIFTEKNIGIVEKSLDSR